MPPPRLWRYGPPHSAERTVDLLLPALPEELIRSGNPSLSDEFHWVPDRREAMALKTLKTETRGRVAIITLNRPDALNALNSELLSELARDAGALWRRRQDRRDRADRIREGLRRRRRHQGNAVQGLCQRLYGRLLRRLERRGRDPQAGDRRGGRLCAGGRLRACHDVRLHYRRRHWRNSASRKSRWASSPAWAAPSG